MGTCERVWLARCMRYNPPVLECLSSENLLGAKGKGAGGVEWIWMEFAGSTVLALYDSVLSL